MFCFLLWFAMCPKGPCAIALREAEELLGGGTSRKEGESLGVAP